MKIVAIACSNCGKHIKLEDLKLLPFKKDKNIQKIWWGCEDCQKKLEGK